MPEAATVLGVTVDAVRGRIRRGKLEAEHDEHGAVYVFIDAEEADGRGRSQASQGPSPTVEGPSPGDARLVEALEDRIASLERQLEAERGANRENRRLLAAALERIPAIEAPRDEPQAPQSVPDTPEGAEPPPDMAGPQTDAQEPEGLDKQTKQTAQRPWWLRWLGG